MVLRRWRCPEHGLQATRMVGDDDEADRCPACGGPMAVVEPDTYPPRRDPRNRMPPRGEGGPL